MSFIYGQRELTLLAFIPQIRDGPNEMAPLMGRYCGDTMPGPMTTTGNTMYVKFRSDVSVATSGFRATWNVGKWALKT